MKLSFEKRRNSNNKKQYFKWKNNETGLSEGFTLPTKKGQFEDRPIGIIRSNDQKKTEQKLYSNLLILSGITNIYLEVLQVFESMDIIEQKFIWGKKFPN